MGPDQRQRPRPVGDLILFRGGHLRQGAAIRHQEDGVIPEAAMPSPLHPDPFAEWTQPEAKPEPEPGQEESSFEDPDS